MVPKHLQTMLLLHHVYSVTLMKQWTMWPPGFPGMDWRKVRVEQIVFAREFSVACKPVLVVATAGPNDRSYHPLIRPILRDPFWAPHVFKIWRSPLTGCVSLLQ